MKQDRFTKKIDIDENFGGHSADNFCSVVGGAMMLGSAVIGADASQKAANTQAGAATSAANAQLQATREANALQQKMWEQAQANQSPYLQAGNTALSALSGGLGLGAAPGANAAGQAAAGQYNGAFTKTFAPSDLTTDPSYAWRLNQGTQNLNASAAARGLLGSGQNLKDITDYGQNAASQEYQNAFNRYNTNQTNLYNRISGLANVGQNTAVGMANQGMASANAQNQNTMAGTSAANGYMTDAAAANAGGQMGAANAFGGALNAGAQYMAQQNTLNRLYPNGVNGSTPIASLGSGGWGSSGTVGLQAPVSGNYQLGMPLAS